MNKAKAVRIAGFTLAVGTTVSLVGFAAHGTGAYFSDAKSGTVTATTGTVGVNISTGSLNYTNLLPGQYQTQHLQYAATGTGPEDIYLALDQTGDAALNGYPKTGPSPLGSYGHLMVHSDAGNFVSDNLATDPAASNPGFTVHGTPNQDCYTDATTGLGGSTDTATRPGNVPSGAYYGDSSSGDGQGTHTLVNYCPAPQYILLASNLTAANGAQDVAVEFGYTQILESGQNTSASLPFRIVAEQAGVSPYDPNTSNTPAS